MDVLDKGYSAVIQALLKNGFHEIDGFDLFATFARDGDPVRIHLGSDGSFAAFDGSNEFVTEGKGPDELYRAIIVKATPMDQRYRLYRR